MLLRGQATGRSLVCPLPIAAQGAPPAPHPIRHGARTPLGRKYWPELKPTWARRGQGPGARAGVQGAVPRAHARVQARSRPPPAPAQPPARPPAPPCRPRRQDVCGTAFEAVPVAVSTPSGGPQPHNPDDQRQVDLVYEGEGGGGGHRGQRPHRLRRRGPKPCSERASTVRRPPRRQLRRRGWRFSPSPPPWAQAAATRAS